MFLSPAFNKTSGLIFLVCSHSYSWMQLSIVLYKVPLDSTSHRPSSLSLYSPDCLLILFPKCAQVNHSYLLSFPVKLVLLYLCIASTWPWHKVYLKYNQPWSPESIGFKTTPTTSTTDNKIHRCSDLLNKTYTGPPIYFKSSLYYV